MKHIPAAILALITVFLMSSCTSANPSRRYPNMVADLDPISVGTVQAVFDRLLSSRLDNRDIEVIFYPRLNAVALEFRHEFVTYRQFWNQEARRLFIAALDRYKADFEARNLVDRYNRTRSAYGRVSGRVEWETFRLSRTYASAPIIELGYRFRSDSPFFATLMRSAKAEDTSGSSPDIQSQQINMYFTRAQADELARLFDQPFLLEFIGERPDFSFQPLTADSYIEFDD